MSESKETGNIGSEIQRNKAASNTSSDNFSKNDLLNEMAEDFRDKKFDQLLGNLQANILNSHGKQLALYAFFTFKPGKKGEVVNWLRNLPITSAKKQLEQRPDEIISIFLSYEGYRYLEQLQKVPRDGSTAFETGLMKRTVLETKHRENNFEKNIHALVLIACDQMEEISRYKKKWVEECVDFADIFFETGFRTTEPQDAGQKKEIRDWFGYRDSISNPRFFKSGNLNLDPVADNETPARLNLVLRPDKGGLPQSFGSYMVFLKFEQNIKAFEENVQKIAEKLKVDKSYVEAQLIGRFKEGTPLALSGEEDLTKSLNTFDYSDDPQGAKCPLHAHIRKANPREPAFEQKRIVRRGMFYGAGPGNNKKGLLFMCFQSDLEQQFEDLLNRRMYRFNPDLPGNDFYEPMASVKSKSTGTALSRIFNTTWNGPKSKAGSYHTEDLFVKFKGGLYFFAPSISFITQCLD